MRPRSNVTTAIWLAFSLFSCSSYAQSPGPGWKYDLRPGDHLVYHYSIDRQIDGADVRSHTLATFNTHVLVLGERDGSLSIGFQRNRESAQLLEYREKGKDKLAQELPGFDARMAKRPVAFDESNEFSPTGQPLNFWQAARETQSKLVMAIHEIQELPDKTVSPGDVWSGHNLLAFTFRFAAVETIDGNQCDRVEGVGAAAQLRYWWCPSLGVVGKLEFEGEYGLPGGGTGREKLVFELQNKTRSENTADWLESPKTRQGALSALLLSPWVSASADVVSQTIESGDANTQALGLAFLFQRQLAPPDAVLIARLAHSENQEVRRIASRLLTPSPPASPLPTPCPQPLQPFPRPPRLGAYITAGRTGRAKGASYIVQVPHDYRGDQPLPLLIYLSGGSGLAIDGLNTANDVVATEDYLVVYPQAADLWWKPEIADRFPDLLDEILHDFNVDANRVYIAGFSNGGTGALYYAALWPQRFAAVVSLMGAGSCIDEVAARLANVSLLPVLFVHGDRDPLISASCSTETDNALRKLAPQTPPAIHILKGREHDITLQTDDGLTLPFLAGKVRDPFPRKIMASLDMAHPRHYWVELVQGNGGQAEVHGEIKANNTLELKTRNVKRLRLLLRPELFPATGQVSVFINHKKVFEGEISKDCNLAGSPVRAPDFALRYSRALDFEITH